MFGRNKKLLEELDVQKSLINILKLRLDRLDAKPKYLELIKEAHELGSLDSFYFSDDMSIVVYPSNDYLLRRSYTFDDFECQYLCELRKARLKELTRKVKK